MLGETPLTPLKINNGLESYIVIQIRDMIPSAIRDKTKCSPSSFLNGEINKIMPKINLQSYAQKIYNDVYNPETDSTLKSEAFLQKYSEAIKIGLSNAADELLKLPEFRELEAQCEVYESQMFKKRLINGSLLVGGVALVLYFSFRKR